LIVLAGRDADRNTRTEGAAYDPAKNAWRRIAAPPQERLGSIAVWDGKEVLVVAGSGPPGSRGYRKLVSIPFAYNPATDRWRTLQAMDNGEYGRSAATAVWTGDKLLLWGGETQAHGAFVLAPHGLAYDPVRNRWSSLPGAPLNGRLNPIVVWTGKALLVWGGDPIREQIPGVDDWWPLLDGATFGAGRQ
jgi:N-acetylneuraminic acid mutarotase